MKTFRIGELLFYNPTLKSQKKKPIEIDTQEAKIIAYYPSNVQIEQKCNSVGMAQGVYEFCSTLLGQQQNKPKYQCIIMNQTALVLKQVEEDIWLFIKLDFDIDKQYNALGASEQNSYVSNIFTQDNCQQILDHIYYSFQLFYGNVGLFVFRQKLKQLEQILHKFVNSYSQIFKYESCLDLISYVLKDIRLIPLDINSTLKFNYFKNVIQSYDDNIAHIMVFAGGYLAFSSLPKQPTQYFSNYLFANGDPYNFIFAKKNKLRLLVQFPKGRELQRFGVLYNSKKLGFDQNIKQTNDRNSLGVRISNIKQSGVVDLLGLEDKNKIELFDIYLNLPNEENKTYKLNFYMEKSMVFLTFYRRNVTFNQIVFQNRFYHDNSDKFTGKIAESLGNVMKPNDTYKFIFHNTATYSGKSTLKDIKIVGLQIKYGLDLMLKMDEGVVATSYQGWWVYGVRRFSRLLIFLIPNDVPLHKLDEFVSKMTKQYFLKAFI